MPLLDDAEAREHWPNEQLIQISESMTGRAIRTLDWTYCVADLIGARAESSQPIPNTRCIRNATIPVSCATLRGVRSTGRRLRSNAPG